jgi:hypothetical protein
MVNGNKPVIFVFVIIIMTLFTIPSFSQDKPSLYVTHLIVTRLIMQEFSKINTREINDIKITKEFMSRNGRYCIEVSYNRISNTGKIYPEKGNFFIIKQDNIWIGGEDGCVHEE